MEKKRGIGTVLSVLGSVAGVAAIVVGFIISWQAMTCYIVLNLLFFILKVTGFTLISKGTPLEERKKNLMEKMKELNNTFKKNNIGINMNVDYVDNLKEDNNITVIPVKEVEKKKTVIKKKSASAKK